VLYKIDALYGGGAPLTVNQEGRLTHMHAPHVAAPPLAAVAASTAHASVAASGSSGGIRGRHATSRIVDSPKRKALQVIVPVCFDKM
jgi:hypothetical protein